MNLYFARPKKETKQIKTLKKILSQYWKVIDPIEENIGIQEEDIPTFDYGLISTCDIVFLYYPRNNGRCIGRTCEMVEAREQGKLIYCLTYEPNPFLNKYCDKIWYSWDQFINDL